MEIQREAYLNQLIERRDNGMIKIVTGIRRCGKSYLLFTIFKRYLLESGVPEDHIIEIALDGIENEELRDPKVASAISRMPCAATGRIIFCSMKCSSCPGLRKF